MGARSVSIMPVRSGRRAIERVYRRNRDVGDVPEVAGWERLS
ncbi:hypothetical protein LC55x_1419 [Lysobacter capsici]|nr:hypothetical protein LC55x_1419 [Lysobacter capsici]